MSDPNSFVHANPLEILNSRYTEWESGRRRKEKLDGKVNYEARLAAFQLQVSTDAFECVADGLPLL